jgi:hypothetical protein
MHERVKIRNHKQEDENENVFEIIQTPNQFKTKELREKKGNRHTHVVGSSKTEKKANRQFKRLLLKTYYLIFL